MTILRKQAGSELDKAHAKLKFTDAFEAEVGVEVAVKGGPMGGGSEQMKRKLKTSRAAQGALAHRLQRETAWNTSLPAKTKMGTGGPQIAEEVLEHVHP